MMLFRKVPFVILLFPMVLALYIVVFKGNLSYDEEILISSNIDKVIKVHENPDFLQYFLDGFISYKKIENSINNEEAQIEITLLFDPNESVSKKIIMNESVVYNDLPNEKKVIYSSPSVKNTVISKFVKIDQNTTKIYRKHVYEFKKYSKVSSFFLTKKIKRKSFKYLNKFKDFVENNYEIKTKK
tara:strand:- start:60 stop:614 length:555 start_codon:yes stop_codon:yes gene_type:complete